MSQRTFGWVQNPSSFENLKRAVGILIPNSSYNLELKGILDNKNFRFSDDAIRNHLKQVISKPEIKPTYLDLVGTSFSPRSSAPCDALVQAIIPSQKPSKPYIDNWSADGFVRWAEALGFIDYEADSDTFVVTELGREFVADDNDFNRNKSLETGLLRYPPVHRVLGLLNTKLHEDSDENFLSKFQIGSRLGFMGEAGFTSISYNLVIEQLKREADKEVIKDIRSNVEGSSDKYARMICKWLVNMGWVRNAEISIFNEKLKRNISLGHCFEITLEGTQKLNQLEGASRYPMIVKRLSWYMLATNARNKDYLRNRRYAILEYLKNKNGFVSLYDITEYVNSVVGQGRESVFVINKDIMGLEGIGLLFEYDMSNNIRLASRFSDFKPPSSVNYNTKPVDENLESYKRILLERLPHISPEWVELVEISRDKKQSRIFELKVNEILKTYYKLSSLHLGGASKPDCICWSNWEDVNWGIIVDAKAYKDGFSFPISERDKMVRYIDENKKRDKAINRNEWWLDFPSEVQKFYFLFVSSKFGANANSNLEDIYNRTNVNGGALGVEQLLMGAEFNACADLNIHNKGYINLADYLHNKDIMMFSPILQ